MTTYSSVGSNEERRLRAEVQQLLEQNQKLQAEIAGLREDKARLDWLCDNAPEHFESDALRCFEWHQNLSVRDAIDAARGAK